MHPTNEGDKKKVKYTFNGVMLTTPLEFSAWKGKPVTFTCNGPTVYEIINNIVPDGTYVVLDNPDLPDTPTIVEGG